MAQPTAPPSTERQPIRDEQLCEFWPEGGRPCYAPAEWSVITPWWSALYHACEVHRDVVEQGVAVAHRVVRVEEWRASLRGYRPGLAGS